VTLRPLPEDISGEELHFIGPVLSMEIAQRVARAEVDPHRHEPFEVAGANPSSGGANDGVGNIVQDVKMYSRRRNGAGTGLGKSPHAPVLIQKNTLSNYFCSLY
jgi:hypothetical protein